MKGHIGVDVKTGLTHTFTKAANKHYLNQAHHLIYGKKKHIFVESRYRGAQKREELNGVKADWYVAEQTNKVKKLKELPSINTMAIKIEYFKASMCFCLASSQNNKMSYRFN